MYNSLPVVKDPPPIKNNVLVKYDAGSSTLSFAHQFTDPDGDDLTYTAFVIEGGNPKPLPYWIVLDIANKNIIIKPLETFIGQYTLQLIATDPYYGKTVY